MGSTDLGGDGGAAGIPWKMPSGEPLWQKKPWKNQEKLNENHQQVAFDHEIMLI